MSLITDEHVLFVSTLPLYLLAQLGMPMKDICRRASHILFPTKCASCNSSLFFNEFEGLCDACRQCIVQFQQPCCAHCGQPYPSEVHEANDLYKQQGLHRASCAQCHHKKPPFSFVKSVYVYHGIVRQLLFQFKYRAHMPSGRALQKLFSVNNNWLATSICTIDLCVPVPLHIEKLRQRGFNQSWYLLQGLKVIPRKKRHPTILQRLRATVSQVSLDAHDRHDNMKDALRVNPRYLSMIQNKTILLIDDVYTTGATARCCAKALLDAGASKVLVYTLCRGNYKTMIESERQDVEA